MKGMQEGQSRWSVIAGGEGQRMRPLIQRWLGGPRPKQYSMFVGGRSMFQHTLDRADMLISPARRVTIAARSQLAVIPNAAHLSNLKQPEAFNQAMRKFLKGL